MLVGGSFVSACRSVDACFMGPSCMAGYERGVTDELPTVMVMLMRNVDMLLLLL